MCDEIAEDMHPIKERKFRVRARPMILREGVDLTSIEDDEVERFLEVIERNKTATNDCGSGDEGEKETCR